MTADRKGKSLFTDAMCAEFMAATHAKLRKPDRALKGIKGENCNRTACQQPGAHYFNVGSRAYYCWACASDINEFAMRPHADGSQMNLFPTLEADRRERLQKEQRKMAALADVMREGQARRSAVQHTQDHIMIDSMAALADRAGAVVTMDEIYDLEPTAYQGPKQKAQWKRERHGRR